MSAGLEWSLWGSLARRYFAPVRLRIAELLEAADMTPYEFAKRSGISRSAVYRIVQRKGRVAYFDAELLDALVSVLGVRPDDLFEPSKRGKASR